MIYPKRKKVIQAASGLDAAQIESVDNAIMQGANAIPVYGQAISAGLSIGKTLGAGIEGNGQNGVKNAVADIVNPLSSVNALMSGKPLEAIPLVGGFVRAKRMSKEAERLDRMQQNKDTALAAQQSNAKFSTLTYGEGGSIPGDDSSSKSEAVVLGGKTHEDGGNALVDKESGEKVAETEREELLFSADQTKKIETYISLYDKSNDESHLIDLGKCIQKIVMTEMVDQSKKFSV